MSTDASTTDDLATLLRKELRGESLYDPDIPEAPREPIFRAGDAISMVSLVAVALADDAGPCGRDIVRVVNGTGWGTSPGTIYPRLHDLEDEGLIDNQEIVNSKRYHIDDVTAADDRLAAYEKRLSWLLESVWAARDALDTDTDD